MVIRSKWMDAFFPSLIISILIQIVASPFRSDLISLLSGSVFLYLLISAALFFVFIFLIHISSGNMYHVIDKNSIRKYRKRFGFSHVSTSTFDTNSDSFEISSTLLDRFFKLSVLSIYSKNVKRIARLRMNEREIHHFESEFLGAIPKSKVPYRKNIANNKGISTIISAVLNILFMSLPLFILLLSIIDGTGLGKLRVFSFIFNKYVTITIYYFILFVLLSLYRISSTMKSYVKIMGDMVIYENGSLTLRKYYFNKRKFKNSTILLGPFDSRLEESTILISLSKFKSVLIPVSSTNASSLVFDRNTVNEKAPFNLWTFLVALGISAILSLVLSLVSYKISIVLFIIGIILGLIDSIDSKNLEDKRYLYFINGFLVKRYKIMEKENILDIKPYRIGKNLVVIKYHIFGKTLLRALSREEYRGMKTDMD